MITRDIFSLASDHFIVKINKKQMTLLQIQNFDNDV